MVMYTLSFLVSFIQIQTTCLRFVSTCIYVILFILSTEGEMRAGRSMVNLDFTFDVFICVAILIMYREDICKASDAASIYGTLNR